jgi:hypothetical protein
MSVPKAVALALGGIAVAALSAGWWLTTMNRRSIQEIAAPHLACPADRIRVQSDQRGDLEDGYRVEGCGKSGRVLCAAQDPKCEFWPE